MILPDTLLIMQENNDPFAAITAIQDRAVDEIREEQKAGKPAFLEAPTGAGKTRINARTIAKFIKDFRAEHDKDPYIVVYAHREKLINHGRDELAKWAPEIDLPATLSSSVPTPENPRGGLDQSGNINFCMVQTGAANLDILKPADLVIVDEAHHASDNKDADHAKVLDRQLELNPNAEVLLVTATPNRPDQKGLHRVAQEASPVVITYKELERARQINLPNTKQMTIHSDDGVSLNSIMKSRYKPEKDADASGLAKHILKHRPADFNDQVLDGWERHYHDPSTAKGEAAGTLVYETNTKTAKQFYEDAKERGISVALVDSTHDHNHNRKTMDDYVDGKIDMIVSVKMIDEGVDLPRTRCVMINRATTSHLEYDQMVGRSVRCGSDPALRDVKPTVLDAGASTMMHGSVERRAVVKDYIQRLQRGEVKEDIGQEQKAEDRMMVEGEYSPWVRAKDPPPVFCLTDGRSHMYAVAHASPDGKTRYALSETSVVKGRPQLTVMKGEDGRPLISVNASKLHEIEASRVLPERAAILRLSSTDSLDTPGSKMYEDLALKGGGRNPDSAAQIAQMMMQNSFSR